MISVLMPTRGRPDLLQRAIDSFRSTTDDCAEIILRIDEDDEPTLDLVCNLPPGRRADDVRVIVGKRLDGYTSLLRFMHECAQHARGSLLMPGNDDMIFRTPQWDALLLDEAAHFPDGIYAFSPNAVTDGGIGHPFATVSRWWFDTLGFVHDQRLFWGDVFVREVALRLDRLIPLRHVVIEHAWARDRRPEAQEQEKDYGPDNHVYWDLHLQAVNEAVAKLGGLRTNVA